MGEPSSSRLEPLVHVNQQNNMTVIPDIFDEFEAYRFSDDPDFRAGLPTVIAAIRGQERSANQIDEMIGRAQWFYFARMKGVSIPWEAYARRQRNHPYVDPASPKSGLILSRTESPTTSPSGSSHMPLPTKRANSGPHEALQTLNRLAEAREMMKDAGNGPEGGDAGGLSFSMLSRLIAEGRTEEVPVKKIPEGTNDIQPQRASMSARPKPWEIAQGLPPTSSFTYGPGTGLSISPTSQSNGLYLSSGEGANYSYSLPPENTSYNPSPSLQGRNWATSGPTISPDLRTFDAITLDPEFPIDPLTTQPRSSSLPSSNQISSYQTSSIGAAGDGGRADVFDPMDSSSFPSFNDSINDTFNDYLDFDFGQNPGKQGITGVFDDDGLGVGNGIPSPGVFGTSSSSTPAPSSRTTELNRRIQSQSQDHTPTSSHSL